MSYQAASTTRASFSIVARELVKALGHFPSWVIVIAAVLLLAVRSPWGIFDFDVREVGAIVFQISGTMVALILPASQLANSFVARLEDQTLRVIIEDRSDPQKKLEAADRVISSLRDNLYPAWRASSYIFISFVLAATTLIIPSRDVDLGPLCMALSIDRTILITSLGCLVVGSAWFLPTAHYTFGLQILDDVKHVITAIVKTQNPIAGASKGSGPEPETVAEPPKDASTKVDQHTDDIA